ncbi:hypothetical protein K9L27_00310 [Candidatus Gracilibacteria bacterium]|nr:hypothetical protein [Candidatus Gracilibacteria bacterium]
MNRGMWFDGKDLENMTKNLQELEDLQDKINSGKEIGDIGVALSDWVDNPEKLKEVIKKLRQNVGIAMKEREGKL